MRDILFRGKRTDNGEWVEGIPIKTHIGTFIVFEENPHFCSQYGYMEIDGLCLVIPETVGQFTGLTDKNGKKIFEGDVFATKCSEGVITFKDDYGTFGFQVWWKGFPDYFATFKEFGEPYFEVIGNIHDNPELLKGEE